MTDCIFCKIIKGEIPAHKIYEDGGILAFLDINPINPGHTLVIPKTHSENLLEAPDRDLVELIKVVKKIALAVIKGVGADSFNLGLNNGKESGQIIFHTHFHIIPRFSNDGHKPWGGQSYKDSQAEEIAAKIKSNL